MWGGKIEVCMHFIVSVGIYGVDFKKKKKVKETREARRRRL
jgi:hypothetical protein